MVAPRWGFSSSGSSTQGGARAPSTSSGPFGSLALGWLAAGRWPDFWSGFQSNPASPRARISPRFSPRRYRMNRRSDAPTLRRSDAPTLQARSGRSAPAARPDRHRVNPPTGSGCGEVSRRGRDGWKQRLSRIKSRRLSARIHGKVGMDGMSDWHRMALRDPRGKKRSPETASRPKRGTERGGEQGAPGGCRELLQFIFDSPAEGRGLSELRGARASRRGGGRGQRGLAGGRAVLAMASRHRELPQVSHQERAP